MTDAAEQREIVRRDPYLASAYRMVYDAMLAAEKAHLRAAGLRIEIGASGGFLTEIDSGILGSDVRDAPDLDVVFDARALPVRDASVATIFSKDCLHHIPDVERFLEEVQRCVVPGGGVVCVEPYWGPLAQVVYRWFHAESFVTDTTSWQFETADPLDANQALLYLMLRRDRPRLARDFPRLEVIEVGPLIGPSYALSGGVSRRGLLPARALNAMRRAENRTRWWRGAGALGFLCVFRVREA